MRSKKEEGGGRKEKRGGRREERGGRRGRELGGGRRICLFEPESCEQS